MKLYIAIFPILAFFACSYSDKDFEFSPDELKIINAYKRGDTIVFGNGKGGNDTILVLEIGFGQRRLPGILMSQPAYNKVVVEIRHLPIDKWTGTSTDFSVSDKTKKTVYQNIMALTKWPQSKTRWFSIQFKDFYADSNDGWPNHSDTLLLNGKHISNYMLVEKKSSRRDVQPTDIECVYWTNELGLTAYKRINGEYWTRER